MPPASEYARALDAALREYEGALAEHAKLETRLAELRQSILHLTKLCGYQSTIPFGLTEACRMVLQNATAPLTALGIRDRLESIGFDLDRYANPLAAVHTTLKRLAEAGEAEPARDPSARTAYQRAQPTTRQTADSLTPAALKRKPRRGRT